MCIYLKNVKFITFVFINLVNCLSRKIDSLSMIHELCNIEIHFYIKLKIMRNLYFICVILVSFLVSCTPKSYDLISSADLSGTEFKEKDIDVDVTENVATIKEEGIDINTTLAKSVLNLRFNDIKKISDIEVKNFTNNGPYYLLGKGLKDKKEILLAIELERKGLELHSAEYNMLHSSCMKKGCDDCTFTIDKNGEIEDCRCQSKKSNPNTTTKCQHRSFIKTVEKDF